MASSYHLGLDSPKMQDLPQGQGLGVSSEV